MRIVSSGPRRSGEGHTVSSTMRCFFRTGLFLVLVAAAGCITPYDELTYKDWVKADASKNEFEIDHDACTQIATVPETVFFSGLNGKAERFDEELFLQCMQQADWKLREDWERDRARARKRRRES